MFAVVTISGKQYPVSVGDQIQVDKIDGAAGDTIELDHVLLTENNKEVRIGTPTVRASVTAKIVSQDKGEKISVRRYKSKVRYRKHTGFRARLTKLEIVSIT